MDRPFATLVLGLALGLGPLGCGSVQDPWKDHAGPPRVVSSFPPLTSFVKAVGGDRVGVMTLCTTTGPHDYQFSIRDTILLRKANLLLGNGLGLDDHFLDQMNGNSGNAKLVFRKLGEAVAKADLHENPDYVPGKHEHKEDGSCCGGHGPHDPHVWLGIPQAAAMIDQLRRDLSAIDPAGAASYQQNADRLVSELKALQAEGRARLAKLDAPLITFHDSMGYFAESFGLKRLGSIQANPGTNPDPKRLARLVESCKDLRRVVIALEPQYPTSSADTLKRTLREKHRDLEVLVVTLDPLETADGADVAGDWYLSKMRANVEALAKHVP